jgi:hypothetical protein
VTLAEIKAVVLSADPTAEHYESSKRNSDSYTVWREVRRLAATADDRHIEGWAFQVDRFTRAEGDPVAEALFEALDASDRVAVHYEADYEQDTEYIHHIYDCEGF